MSFSYEIRDALNGEAEYLSELTLRSKAYWGYSKEFLERCRPHLVVSTEYIENWPVRVLESSQSIIGYMSLKEISGETRLDNLWIEPEYIKHGYGTILFKEAISQARKLNWKTFRMAVEEQSIGFYEKLGAKIVGKVQSRLGGDIFLTHMEFSL